MWLISCSSTFEEECVSFVLCCGIGKGGGKLVLLLIVVEDT